MLLTSTLVAAVFSQGCYGAHIQTFLSGTSTALARTYHSPSNRLLSAKCQRQYLLGSSAIFMDQVSGVAETRVPSPPLVVNPLVVSGPSSNRVDLVFFSDGYLMEEYNKFIEDAARLAEDILGNQTFSTVGPLLNFWAAFSPSKESGIGVGGKPKDTPFGLYRDGTELRAVYYDKPEIAEAACSSLGNRCDYPILIGNDPYYGGLGGDFSVITSSVANGPLVLRHELGHSIIDVGEEYDGGFAYFGPNAAHNLSEPLPWAHWLSSTDLDPPTPRIERASMPMQQYPWTLLNTSIPWSITFESSGTYSRHLVRFSLSGLPGSGDLKVELNGVDLGWTPKSGIGLDRWHYDIYRNGGLPAGENEVKFILTNPDREGTAQLCSTEVLEFGTENEFISTPGHYGIYPTFSEKNKTSYRPTNEDCLMRSVTTPNFCKVCTEGLWLSLLRRISLIDDIKEECEWRVPPANPGSAGKVWVKTINIDLVPLAQFRENITGMKTNESYTITWWKGPTLLQEFTNKTRVEVGDEDAMGTYSIQVKFTTDEVRMDREGLLSSTVEYEVKDACGSMDN